MAGLNIKVQFGELLGKIVGVKKIIKKPSLKVLKLIIDISICKLSYYGLTIGSKVYALGANAPKGPLRSIPGPC